MDPGFAAGWAPVPTFGDFPLEEQMNLEESSAPLNEETPAPQESREPVGAGTPAGMPGAESPRLKVLESLGRGEITVQEASALLRSLSGQ
ncbi:MAG TPA: hypothetical protein VN837_15815 [Chloroflexota bacterium]|nr:hypothetical protein [Chloroflexota bacterium]